jgi:Rps23 Pro-64 3,4-dihydroxylase Tpa1-like proline 4-hydroxylase
MTPKQILDSFSETLMQDDRILSAPERALVATLLQHAKAATTGSQETQQAVRAVIASAVGETVAQRAFGVLGGSIVERILQSNTESSSTPVDSVDARAVDIETAKKGPQPPGVKAPQPPVGNPPVPPQPPGEPLGTPPVVPPPPQPPGHGVRTTVVSETSLAVANLPARCVVLDEFLAPQEVEELTRFTLERETDFRTSEVISPNMEGGIVDYEHRRSRVLMDLAQHRDLMFKRINVTLPQVLQKLGMEEFSVADLEVQVTASNDGDFFRFHADNDADRVAARRLTFVYFFHREPRQFEGGELRIHDARLEEGGYVSAGSYHTIVPEQNQIVFFPCELMHEITPVKCVSRSFADSRFTLNGWLRR